MLSDRAPRFVTHSDIIRKFPGSFPSRHQFLRMADAGKAPAYVRTSLKAEPLFLESAILQFIREKYFDLIPEYVLRLEKEGLLPSSDDRGV